MRASQVFVLVLLAGVGAAHNDGLDAAKREELSRQMAEMLGVDPAKSRPQNASQASRAISRYMQKLFEKHSKNPGPLDGNTIRSLSPKIDGYDSPYLHFDLSTIPRTEQVVKAQVHFHQRGPGRAHEVRVRVRCGWCSPPGTMLETRAHTAHAAAWLHFDVTRAVAHLVQSGNGTATLEFTRRNVLIHPLKVQRLHSAFLVVYTSEAETLFKEGDRPAKRAKRSLDDYYRYMPIEEVNQGPQADQNQVDQVDQMDQVDQVDQVDQDRHQAVFRRRWNMVRRAGPRILQPRATKKRKFRPDPSDPMMGFGQEPVDEPTTTSTRRPQMADFDEDHVSFNLLDQKRGEEEEVCGKRAALVRFRDIGWADWIIAPAAFAADFCAGACAFPLGARHAPTNHAQLQAIVHALAARAVPAVCCAPSRLDSLTLLFHDERGNVVLKNFPRALVRACGCL